VLIGLPNISWLEKQILKWTISSLEKTSSTFRSKLEKVPTIEE
jgi:hypothetical protein